MASVRHFNQKNDFVLSGRVSVRACFIRHMKSGRCQPPCGMILYNMEIRPWYFKWDWFVVVVLCSFRRCFVLSVAYRPTIDSSPISISIRPTNGHTNKHTHTLTRARLHRSAFCSLPINGFRIETRFNFILKRIPTKFQHSSIVLKVSRHVSLIMPEY